MIQILTGLAIGIVIFAVSIGVGLVVLTKFGDANAECATDYTYNATSRSCENATGGEAGDPTDPANTVWTTIETLNGSTNGLGALVTWVGAIIALLIGVAFIGLLMGKKQY